jgi:hypothetical protein
LAEKCFVFGYNWFRVVVVLGRKCIKVYYCPPFNKCLLPGKYVVANGGNIEYMRVNT